MAAKSRSEVGLDGRSVQYAEINEDKEELGRTSQALLRKFSLEPLTMLVP